MSEWEAAGKSDDWYTPKYIFDALCCTFDLDVAPPIAPTHVPAKLCLHAESLQHPWIGFVWMNAPFGRRNGLAPWLDKFFEHGNGIALMPDRTSAPWFQAAVKRANALLFISPRVKFERPDGTTGDKPGSGIAFLSSGSRGRAALLRAGSLGFVTPLTPAEYPRSSPSSAKELQSSPGTRIEIRQARAT